MLWANETHLPGWPPGPSDGVTVRAVRAARDVVLRLGTARATALETNAKDPPGDEAA